MKSVALHNLGCKVNAYELEVMQQKLQDRGYKIVPFDSDADIYIVNTCTVTNIADRKSRQMLHRAKHRNPDAVVVAVGCFVQAGEENRMDDCIDLAVGNQHKKDIVEILEAYLEEHTADASAVTDIGAVREYEEMRMEQSTEHTRAYIKIQDGCNQFCSYCIIPYARGPVRSLPLAEAVAQAFRFSKLVLATPTYNADVFPFMKEFIHHLTERNYQNRTVAFIENGSWAPMAAKVMTKMLEGSKNLTYAATTVTVRGALNAASEAQLAALADELSR